MKIEGSAGGDVTLKAPYIALTNTSNTPSTSPGASDSGTGSFALAGDYIDVQGSVLLSCFRDVTLRARSDLRLSDKLYSDTKQYAGDMGLTGNLTLQAARVYPTSMTDFTISSKGKVSILPA